MRKLCGGGDGEGLCVNVPAWPFCCVCLCMSRTDRQTGDGWTSCFWRSQRYRHTRLPLLPYRMSFRSLYCESFGLFDGFCQPCYLSYFHVTDSIVWPRNNATFVDMCHQHSVVVTCTRIALSRAWASSLCCVVPLPHSPSLLLSSLCFFWRLDRSSTTS